MEGIFCVCWDRVSTQQRSVWPFSDERLFNSESRNCSKVKLIGHLAKTFLICLFKNDCDPAGHAGVWFPGYLTKSVHGSCY